MDKDELAGWLRLQLCPRVGNAGARKLLAAFGAPEAIFQQSASALQRVLPGVPLHHLQDDPPNLRSALDTTWNWLQEQPDHRRFIPLDSPLYPQSLLQIADPPPLLYGMGMARAWSENWLNQAESTCFAVIGSRNPTTQGAANARQFALALAEAGLCIVSGLALGIDGAAHTGALDCTDPAGLPTLAVVGTGLDRVYPRQHQVLARRIAQRGLLLSEYPLGTPALAANFPQRNRIISGLSRGALVVEATLKSGSLITARMAVEQGKDVFAIPGSIHSVQSHGCHSLIKQGAKLVECAQDVLEELPWQSLRPAPSAAAGPDPVPESALLQALEFSPCNLDALQARTGLNTAQLQANLMELELLGHVERLPGGLFQRLARA
jgi:DNA processing protein